MSAQSRDAGPIGIFDSGYGGLTVMKEIVATLPQYDYLYLGDNARTPYGTRSFDTIYAYTLECVQYLFDHGCSLVILACNTASAKALRTIQQKDLPRMDPSKRVLGVIRPTAEVIGNYTKTGSVGVLGTSGTIKSNSYILEIEKQFPNIKVYQQSCPMWVPLVENGEAESPGADFFIKKELDNILGQSAEIDTILLACTHYPLLIKKITENLPAYITVLSQGSIVAQSLADYLQRHPDKEARCSKNGSRIYQTTDDTTIFDFQAKNILGNAIASAYVHL
jgi:glutamate racemase